MTFLTDLFRVGKNKPVGYLPLATLRMESSEQELIDWAKEKGFSHKLYKPTQCNIGSGALFIYDTKALQKLLTKYETVLKNAKVPTTPDAYVDFIAKYNVVEKKAFRVVGKSFADKRFK